MATGDRNYDIAKETTSQAILDTLGEGVGGGVKHIQRGTFTYNGTYSDITKEIELAGFTNLDKMVVQLRGNFIWLRSGWVMSEVYVKELTLTKLVCEPSLIMDADYNSGNTSTCSYEVIEFY